MKRTDALRLIANTIYDNTFRTSMLETLPLAEKVLEAIEKAGMLPPLTVVNKFGEVGHDWEKEGSSPPLYLKEETRK